MRAEGEGHFTDEECLNAKRIVDHLLRAIALQAQNYALRDAQRLSEHALDQIEVDIIALDTTGRPCYCNAMADAFLRERRGFELRQGKVHAIEVAADDALQLARSSAVERGVSSSIFIRETKPDIRQCMTATLSSLPSEHSIARFHQSAKLLMLVNDSSRRRTLTTRQIIQMFGLTEAEARLARALTQGDTVEQYALDNQRSVTTLRAQMRSIFAKTGVGRQAELVRLLVTVPALRD